MKNLEENGRGAETEPRANETEPCERKKRLPPMAEEMAALAVAKYLTVAEAGRYARTSVWNVYDWIKKGLIVAFAPPGGRRLVRRTDIDGMLKQHRVTDDMPCARAKGREGVLRWHAQRRAEKAAAQAQEQDKQQGVAS